MSKISLRLPTPQATALQVEVRSFILLQLAEATLSR
jgi:hypothetical protein